MQNYILHILYHFYISYNINIYQLLITYEHSITEHSISYFINFFYNEFERIFISSSPVNYFTYPLLYLLLYLFLHQHDFYIQSRLSYRSYNSKNEMIIICARTSG